MATPTRRPRLLTALCGGVIAAALFHGCNSSSDLFTWTFSVGQAVPEQTIPGDAATAGNPLSIQIVETMPDIGDEPEYQAEVFDFLRLVVSAEVTLSITGTSPTPDFSFIDSILITVGPPGGGAPITEIANLPSGDPQFAGSTLTLTTTELDVTDLLETGAYELTVDVQGVVPANDVIFDGTVDFDITVGLR